MGTPGHFWRGAATDRKRCPYPRWGVRARTPRGVAGMARREGLVGRIAGEEYSLSRAKLAADERMIAPASGRPRGRLRRRKETIVSSHRVALLALVLTVGSASALPAGVPGKSAAKERARSSQPSESSCKAFVQKFY